jgi:hypothetical protein
MAPSCHFRDSLGGRVLVRLDASHDLTVAVVFPKGELDKI